VRVYKRQKGRPVSDKAEMYELFPTAVIKFDVGRDFSEKELLFVKSFEGRLHRNMLNWMTEDNDILGHAPMQGLREIVTKRLNQYFRHVYQPSTNVECYITQSWINYSYGGEAHHQHFHSNSFLSGCMYIQAEEGDRIRYWDKRMDWFSIPAKEENKYNSKNWWIPANAGDIIVWPAELPHDVPQLEKERSAPRISLAFNAFLKGTIGSGGFHSILHLKG